MKHRKLFVCGSAVCALAVISLLILPVARATVQRCSCQGNIGAICAVMQPYMEDHNGEFPPNLTALALGGYVPLSIFKCPNTKTIIGSVTNVDQWSDFLYIYWSEGKQKTPQNFPLMYDRRLSNHGGRGINVFLVPAGGELRPQQKSTFFWDEGASWLKTFSREHPQLNIPMPEDIK